jgi:hypothetical protein
VAVVDEAPETRVVVVVDEGVLGDTVDGADVGGGAVVAGVPIESVGAGDVGAVVGPPWAGTDAADEGLVVWPAGWLPSEVVGRPQAVVVVVVVADFPEFPDVVVVVVGAVVVGVVVALVVGAGCVVAVEVGGSVVAVVGGSIGGSVGGGGLTRRKTGVPGETHEPAAGRWAATVPSSAVGFAGKPWPSRTAIASLTGNGTTLGTSRHLVRVTSTSVTSLLQTTSPGEGL